VEQENIIGRRIREIRMWRQLSQTALAELAGFSSGYLSRIESGERRVEKRATLEALATALKVAPSELAATPFPPRDDVAAEARAAVGFVEAVVADIRLGDPIDMTPRAWPEIAAELNRLNNDLRPRADYAAQGFLLPKLIEELHAIYNTEANHQVDALHGLAACYHAAAMLGSNMGVRGIGPLAADRQVTVAERLEHPAWIAHAAWVRTLMIGGSNRERQATFVLRSIAEADRQTLTPELVQALGQLHLAAALAYSSVGDEDQAWTHFGEAETLAAGQEAEVGTFGCMWFGRTNVQIWKVGLGAEFGYGGKVAELAQGTRPEILRSPVRECVFYADLGRALAQEKRTRGDAVRLLRKAEDLAPQYIRNKPLIRETVADLMQRAQHDTVGRELRGMAYRFGLAG